MDVDYFAELLRTLPTPVPRRGLLAALIGGLLTALPFPRDFDETVAKNSSKRRHRRKHQARRKKRQQQTSLSPSGPVSRVDATCPSRTGAFLITDGDERIAQTFTAIRTGPLVQAVVEVFKVSGTTGDYILHLGAVNPSGIPTNDVLAESVVANARVPDFSAPLTFGFANPATVVAGTAYALVLTRPGSTQLEGLGSFGNPCAGRAFTSSS
jgi:hypothetical protein